MTNLIVVRTFFEGRWIMYPILLTSIVGLTVIIERVVWWQIETWRREPAKLEQVLVTLDKGDIKQAIELAGSRGRRLRCG
jgi:biopolymer transport protein ExbB/TolQ